MEEPNPTPTTGELILEKIEWLKTKLELIETALTSLQGLPQEVRQERESLTTEFQTIKADLQTLSLTLEGMKRSQPLTSDPDHNQPPTPMAPLPDEDVVDPLEVPTVPEPTPRKRRKI
jgi:hypothetical protein